MRLTAVELFRLANEEARVMVTYLVFARLLGEAIRPLVVGAPLRFEPELTADCELADDFVEPADFDEASL